MATASAALGSVASPSTFAISNSQLQKRMEAVSFSPSVFRSRAPIESSSFLGERVTCPPSTSVQNIGASLFVRRGVRSFMGPDSGMRQGASGRIIFTPFGPVFTPNSGRGSNAGREWERRNRSQEERIRAQREMMQRAQQARLRAMIEGQIRNGTGSQERDAALLKELERRLRAEAGRQEGATGQQSDIDELMKQLERRLRPEKESNENTTTKKQQPEYSTVYDYLNAWLKEWDQGMKEERERLQKQWEESNVAPQQPRRESEPDAKPNNPSTNAEEVYDQVFSPEELQRAEEEEKKADHDKSSKHANAPSDGTVVYLKNEANGAELYLVGTSHVSQQSADEVRDVIRKVKPDYVMVELDRKRYNSMMQPQGGRDNPFAFFQQMVQTLANGNIGAVGKLMGLGLSGFYRLLATRGLQPGQEMKVAIEEGKKVGAKIVLGDQDIDITMKHFGEQMSMSDALQFFSRPMPSNIAQKMGAANARSQAGNANPAQMFEQLRDRKIVREFNEVMERDAPAFTRVLLGERNEAMTKALRNLSGKVVGVVGLAHLDGIEQLWREANEKHLNGTQ
ncbi:hypothetical protein KC19_7G036600 [Ceratodon purpureus]|uniref:TraB n=1 Tax=Ceratodon purpureus TaxID=3225 RepID=A0A8T0H5L5_CERPU|nr:hypothetical protein KC19_7G036600 [Ceratodon purpureus]